MGILHFFLIVAICCIGAAVLCWALAKWAPNTPPFVPFVVWGVACFVILVTLLHALGVYGIGDPQIPRVS